MITSFIMVSQAIDSCPIPLSPVNDILLTNCALDELYAGNSTETLLQGITGDPDYPITNIDADGEKNVWIRIPENYKPNDGIIDNPGIPDYEGSVFDIIDVYYDTPEGLPVIEVDKGDTGIPKPVVTIKSDGSGHTTYVVQSDDTNITLMHPTSATISSQKFNKFPTEWQKDTQLHARFDGDYYAGNTDYGVEATTDIIIKRREKGQYKWMPIIEVPVSSSDDYYFEKFDYYANAGTEYEYAFVPIINGIEGTYSIESVTCEFNKLIIMSNIGNSIDPIPEQIASTPYNVTITRTKNNTSATIMPIEARYPIYVANASNNYYTGNISCMFLDTGDTCISNNSSAFIVRTWNPRTGSWEMVKYNPFKKKVYNFNTGRYDIVESNNLEYFSQTKYRSAVMEFLNDRQVKYIKDPDGNSWLAVVGTTVTEEDSGGDIAKTITFDFTEVGDTYSNADMHTFGFLSIGEEWW